MEIFERMSGARMHSNLYRPLLNSRVLSKEIASDVTDLCINTLTTLNEVHTTLTTSKL